MSYITEQDFVEINSISKNAMFDKILKKKDIFVNASDYQQEFIKNINNYYNNLLHINKIKSSAYDKFTNKIIYYYTDNDNVIDYDKIDINKNKKYKLSEIDASFYMNPNMKKYMFLYDFLREYYLNLAEIKKNKYNIDNASLYNHEFKIRCKYLSSENEINNVYHTALNIEDYVITFKFNNSNTTGNKFVQPDITNLSDIKLYSKNNQRIFTNSYDNDYVNSFNELIKIVKNSDIIINNDISYHKLLSESYKYKFNKILLTYIILKIIYFYYRKHYPVKIKEVNDILMKDYPVLLNNISNKVSDKDNSLLEIALNTEKKQFKLNRKPNLTEIKRLRELITIKKGEIRDYIEKNMDKEPQELLNNIKKKESDIENFEKQLSNEMYANLNKSQEQEAIAYKNELDKINKNITNKIKNINNKNIEINSDDSYYNKINIMNYFVIFLLITITVIFIIDNTYSNLNVSISILLLTISIILYLIVNYVINNNPNYIYNNKGIIKNIFNYFSGIQIEKFKLNANSDFNINVTSDPMSLEELNSYIIANTDTENLESKFYLKIKNRAEETEENINIFTGTNINTDESSDYVKFDENGDITIDLKYEENKEYSIYVPNVFNELDDGTIGIKSSILAVGGGAAGTKYQQNVGGGFKRLGEGGGGGAVIHNENFTLIGGKTYKIEIGEGGVVQDDTGQNIKQATNTTISLNNENKIRAKGAELILTTIPAANIEGVPDYVVRQISGADIEGNIDGSVDGSGDGSVDGTFIRNKDNGRGGLSGYNIQTSQGFTYSDSSTLSYETITQNPNDGDSGYEYEGTHYGAGGGSYNLCSDSDGSEYYTYRDSLQGNGDKIYICNKNESDEFVQGQGGGKTDNDNGDAGLDNGNNGEQDTGSGGGGGRIKGGNGANGRIIIKINKEIKDRIESIIKTEIEKLQKELLVEAAKVGESNANDLYQMAQEHSSNITSIKDDLLAGKIDLEKATSNIDILQRIYNSDYLTYTSNQSLLDTRKQRINLYTTSNIKLQGLINATTNKIEINNAIISSNYADLTALQRELENKQSTSNLIRELNVLNKDKLEDIKKEYNTQYDKAIVYKECKNIMELHSIKLAEKRSELSSNILQKRLEIDDKKLERKKELETELSGLRDLKMKAIQNRIEQEDIFRTRKRQLNEELKKLEDNTEKSMIVTFKLNIDYKHAGIIGLNTQKEIDKRALFKDILLNDLAMSLDVNKNRFSIDSITSDKVEIKPKTNELSEDDILLKDLSGYIIKYTENFETQESTYYENDKNILVTTTIYPAPGNLNINNPDEIYNNIETQASNAKSKLLNNTTYFRYLLEYKKEETEINENDEIIDKSVWVKAVDRPLRVKTNSIIIRDNNNKINNIFNTFNEIEKTDITTPTYYERVNPLLKKEYNKFKEKNDAYNLSYMKNKNKQNQRLYNIKYKKIVIDYVISICLLLSILMILYKYISVSLVNLIFIILFTIFTIIFIYKITQILRTKSRNKYFEKN
tara:strand:- start:13619 stop:18103 length:4485 start_codon:yes stop_codon:yes gene_type:complete